MTDWKPVPHGSAAESRIKIQVLARTGICIHHAYHELATLGFAAAVEGRPVQYHIEVVANTNDKCGEAPTWDAANSRLLWVDCDSNLVHALNPDTREPTVISRCLSVSGIAANKDGSWIFAGRKGLHLWRNQDEYRTILTAHDGEDLCLNDILADPRGRIYAGTLYWANGSMTRHGKLYLIAPDGAAQVVDDGIELSNGLGLSPDNRTLYYADTSTRKIYAYDVHPANGKLSARRVFVQLPDDEGLPDGLTVDAAGFVWSAQWYGSQIVRYDPDGKVERRIRMPVKQITSCQFGGPDLSDLYVTTAAISWEGPYAPAGYDFTTHIGGPLYRIRLDIQGKPEYMASF